MANYIYAIDVHKYGEKETLRIVHIVAQHQLQASHIAQTVVYEIGMFDNVPVEIYSVTKLPEIENVVNADDLFEDFDEEEGDGIDDPFDIEGIPGDNIIQFKHTCNSTVTVVDSEWDMIACPTCKEKINRTELENLNGIWCFIPNQKRKNGKKR